MYVDSRQVDRCTRVAALQKTVDVVDAIEAVVVQAQDDLVLPLGLEQRLVEHGRVPVVGHDLGDIIVDISNLVSRIPGVSRSWF